MNRVGIDIGSTTVKIAIIDEQNKILFSAYGCMPQEAVRVCSLQLSAGFQAHISH